MVGQMFRVPNTAQLVSAGFKYGAPMTYDTEGAKNTTAYPVRLRLSGTAWPEGVKAGGADFRLFTDDTLATALPYAILNGEWDDAVKVADVWVLRNVPNSANDEVFAVWGNDALTDGSSPDTVFQFFDDFTSTAKHVFPIGSDSAWSAGFDPVSRRVYFLGGENNSSSAWKVNAWTNIDTGEIGFAKELPTNFTKRVVVYNNTDKLFYLYGGQNAPGSTINEVVTYNPATDVWATLTETLPAATSVSGQAAVYVASSNKVYLFGFDGANILVHDIAAGTITDTGADWRIGSPTNPDVSCVLSNENNLIYLIGGGDAGPSGDAKNNIDTYDPSNESANAVASGITLSEEKTSVTVAEHVDGNSKSFLYVFGGFLSDTSVYSSRIEKITVNGGAESIVTLSATLYLADDDAVAFWDSISGRIYAGPFIHSTGGTNEQDRKIILIALNPVTDVLDTEPPLGAAATGWTSIGTSSKGLLPAAFGSMLRIYERRGNEFIRAQKDSLSLTGEYMLESRLNPANLIPVSPATGDNYQWTYLDSSDVTVFRFNNNNAEISWFLDVGPNPGTLVGSFEAGKWQTLGALIDTANEEVFGLKNRTDRTAALAWDNIGITPSRFWFNNSTAGGGGFVVDWVLSRKCTIGIEPVATLGERRLLIESSIGDQPSRRPGRANTFFTRPPGRNQ